MTTIQSSVKKPTYDLEERTLNLAKNVRLFIKTLKPSYINIEDGKQVIRSSGSIGANYIEANEALSKKDFLMRIKISRKEAKESIYWLKLLKDSNSSSEIATINSLIEESYQLVKILSSIVEKSNSLKANKYHIND